MKEQDETKYNHIFLGKEKDNLDSLFSFTLIHQSNTREHVTNAGVHTWSLDVARYGEDNVRQWDESGIQVIPGSAVEPDWTQFKKDILQLISLMDKHKIRSNFGL